MKAGIRVNTIDMPLLYGDTVKPLSASGNNSTDPSNNVKTSKPSLNMMDFLKLLAAQFENQDISNPTSNTEFISEMAQFSSLQAMSTLAEYSNRQYATSLIGKTVDVKYTDSNNNVSLLRGVVKSASFSGDTDTLTVTCNGHDGTCDLSDVANVIGDSKSSSAGGSSTSNSSGSTESA